MRGALVGIAIVAGFVLLVALTACQSEAAYQATGPRAQVGNLMEQVCVEKLAHPATLTAEWRGFCDRLGVRRA